MLKKIHWLILLIAIVPAIYAQEPLPVIKWQRCYGGTGTETGGIVPVANGAGAYIKAFLADKDGGYVVAGYTTSNNGNVFGNKGDIDMWVVKVNNTGAITWSITLGGSSKDRAISVILDNDGGYLIGGDTRSTDGDVTGNHGNTDAWVIKLDRAGKVVWKKCYGGPADEFGNQIQLVGNTGYIFTSSTYSANGEVSSNHGEMDVWVVRLDRQGNIMWQKSFGGSQWELDYMIKPANDGGFIVLADCSSTDGDAIIPSSYNEPGPPNNWVFKLSAEGNMEWQKRFPGYPGDIEPTSDGGYILSGVVSSPSSLPIKGKGDAYLAKLTSTGNVEWQKNYGGAENDIFEDIIVLPGNYYMVAGTTFSTDGDVSANKGNADYWLVKINQSGELIWEKTFGGTAGDYCSALAQTAEGYITLYGGTKSNNRDVIGNHGDLDIWVVQVGALNSIAGNIFLDVNANGIKDAGESFTDEVKITTQKGSSVIKSAFPSKGMYRIDIDTGTYITKAVPLQNYYTAVPVSRTSSFASYFNSSTASFAIQPTPGKYDLRLSALSLTPARPGFAVTYQLHYKNVGTEVITNGQLLFKYDSRLSFISSTPATSTVSGDTLKWNIANLNLLDSGSVTLQFTLAQPPAANFNDVLNSIAAFPVANDETPVNNTVELNQRVTGSYDPNDKSETHAGIITPEQVSAGDYLNYLIRFQNTGTDTAFIVTIQDTLDSQLDWNSFEMLKASHRYNLQLADGNRLTWTFNDIKLADSTINEPASHGYIAYRIKPKPSVQLTDVIKNSASIYFDFNLPVKTNTHITTVNIAPPVQPIISGLDNNYCGSAGTRKIKIHNLPANGSGIDVTVKVDNTILAVAADSTASVDMNTLPGGDHTLSVTFNNVSDSRVRQNTFTVTAAVTPEVNLNANITHVTNLTTPVTITATNASGGGTAPLYSFAKDKNFTDIIQAEGAGNTLAVDLNNLAIGDNKYFVRMKTSASCYAVQTNIDSITIRFDQSTGITDVDNPGKTINVYPNPFRKDIFINGLLAGKSYLITIYNLQGQQLYSKRVSNRSSVSFTYNAASGGIYWLSIYDEKKKQLLGSVKLVKE